MKHWLHFAVFAVVIAVAGCSTPTSSNAIPATPTGLMVSSTTVTGGDSITITWNAVTGATSYNLYDTKDGTTPTASNYFKVYSITSPNEYLLNVSIGTLYKFAVSAVNSSGASALSGITSTTTP
jgi:hypothetical protein